jgi:Na+-driven multidrug efflux pump
VSFAVPVLGACLAEPLLSMIDTLCVGRLSAVGASAPLAALGVNAAIFNVVACSTAFLCTASTAVIGALPPAAAAAPAATAPLPPPAGAARAFSDGLFLALLVGLAIGGATQLSCGPLLRRFYHLEPGTPVCQQAASYLRIRSLAAPAVTATLVSAGVAFGLGDSRTPLLAVLAAMLVNLTGDLLLIPRMGLVGAAVATAAATWAGALTLGGALAARLRPTWRAPALADVLPFLRCARGVQGGGRVKHEGGSGALPLARADGSQPVA